MKQTLGSTAKLVETFLVLNYYPNTRSNKNLLVVNFETRKRSEVNILEQTFKII